MPKELKLILKEQPVGRESTPWLDPQREKFAQVAREIAQEMKGTKLRGAARVKAFNARISERLKENASKF